MKGGGRCSSGYRDLPGCLHDLCSTTVSRSAVKAVAATSRHRWTSPGHRAVVRVPVPKAGSV